MLALTLFIRYSRMGRACRACAEDLKMASLLGINTDRVIALTLSSAQRWRRWPAYCWGSSTA